MLDSLRLENFKSFKEQTIPLRPLTLLAGLNGMGKSTVLQSLLVLRQSYQQDILKKDAAQTAGLVLNGELTALGTGQDVLFSEAEKDEIGITIMFDGLGETSWRFAYDSDTDVLNHLQTQETLSIYETSLFTNEFHYLQAERLGPRTAFVMSDFMVREQRQMGTRGEFATHFLHTYRDSAVSKLLRHPDQNAAALIDQVVAWMREVSPGTLLRLDRYAEMDMMRLSFGFERPDTVGDVRYFRATNVGFGLTYTLPIVVALLASQPGSLILLENPEAHLHPRGQSQMGDLIARAASFGIQVILETHSDHILNGIRVAVNRGTIDPERVALHFFQRPKDDSESKGIEIVTPRLNNTGRLDFWPENFFDEWDRSLDELL